ncbi:MAG: 50S ribosomal protein L17 [Thermoanaerobaculia bacterium]|nr:MAG: 50S ribosomal protein L17 [Thermoanaerobaculia bacterium]
MQHNRAGRKLGRKTGHRLALFSNQLASLFTSERIVTTLSKAKELRPLAERMVTQGKRGTVHSRRLVGRWIQSREVIKRLFDEIAPRFSTRAGGYLRIVKLGPRIGDGAEMAVLEFVDFQLKKKATPAPEEKAAKGKGKGKEAAPAEGEAEAEAAEKPKKAAKPAGGARPGSKRKAAPKVEKAEPKSKAHTGKSPASTRKSSGPKKTGGS